jgi:hypothetical protein
MPRKNASKASDLLEGKLAYIPCRVEPGMFRGELLAFVDARNPDDPNQVVKAQLLVDQREVAGIQGTPKRNSPVSGWLRVSVVGGKGDWIEVVLPQPSQPLGEAILVNKGTVREEPGP